MRTNLYIVFLLSILSGLFLPTAKGQNRFIENGGQWNTKVAFRSDIPGGKFYIEPDRFTFDLYDVETTEAVFSAHAGNPKPENPPNTLRCHAYQMVFQGANVRALPKGNKPFATDYSFFIGSDSSKWAGHLNAFTEVNYTDLYPGIDLRVYSISALKYDFIIKPGADPNQINIEYKGVKPKINKIGELEIKTSVGDVLESKPFAYQIMNGLKQKVECAYTLLGNELQFELGEYDRSKKLIIDPELIFSTFSGSFADNFGYTATYDAEGHLYSGSTAFGNGYPITVGAYQTEWAGGGNNGSAGTDIAISKFALDGTSLIYSTFIGGNADELPHSLIVNDANEVFLYGTTGSANYPTTTGAYQNNFSGGAPLIPSGIGIAYINGCDMILSRLSADGGSLLGSTYIGGTANDGMNTAVNLKKNYADEVRGEIELDTQGNIVVGSCTFSDDFPVTVNAFQTIKNAQEEGVVFRMNPDMTTLLNSTFFGGAAQDAIYSIHVTADGEITVGGGTSSQDLPTTPGVFQPAYAGGTADGYIAAFDASLQNLDAMTYYGSSGYDQIYFVERDSYGNPHIFGQTTAPDSTFISNAAYSIPNSGMLMSSFSQDLQGRNWSTVFGNGVNVPSLSPTAFSVDICNRIYLSGWGGAVNGFGGTNGLPITPDAIQATTDNNDFYFMVMAADASSLTFGSYYGGGLSPEHVDGGTSRFDRGGKIYQAVCAGCHGNSDFPIFPENAYSPQNHATNGCNLGVVKIDFDLPTVIADFEADPVCLPLSVEFQNTSALFSGSNAFYTWIFPNGDTSFQENPTYLFDAPGTYDVKLVVTEPNACNVSDTVVHSVQVFPELQLAIPDTVQSCTENSFSISAFTYGSANYFQWATDPDFQFIISEGTDDSTLVYSTNTLTSIYIKTSNGLCDQIDTILISPGPELMLSIGDTLLCNGDSLSVEYYVTGGATAANSLWSPDSLILTGQGSDTVIVDASQTIQLGVDIETTFGCALQASSAIEVHPIFLETSGDTLTCTDENISLSANSFGTSQSFQWSNFNDFSNTINPTGDSVITVTPEGLQYYFVKVENDGCTREDSVAVSLLARGTTISNDQYICIGDTAYISVSNDFPGSQLTHQWQPEEYIVSGQGTTLIRVLVSEPTTFTVISTTIQGCETENSATVYTSQLGNATVTATADPQNIASGQSSALSAAPFPTTYNYEWTPQDFLSNPFNATTTASPLSTTTYEVTITDISTFGICAKTDTVTIYVYEAICGEPNIFVPNTFTPNGDGENDLVFVRGGTITGLHFSIFDRWGEKVFETTDQSRGWDGTFKGNLAEPAVYVYYLDAKCNDGQTYYKKGNITLAR